MNKNIPEKCYQYAENLTLNSGYEFRAMRGLGFDETFNVHNINDRDFVFMFEFEKRKPGEKNWTSGSLVVVSDPDAYQLFHGDKHDNVIYLHDLMGEK